MITRGGGFAPAESVDGSYVYFSRRQSSGPDPENAIWRIPVAGGEEEVVVGSLRSSWGNWDLTAEGIYFVDEKRSASGGQWVVRFLGSGQSPAVDVAQLRYPPFLWGPGFSVSSDGHWALSAQGREQSDLMIVENFR
jgi:hypothetical protein